MGVDARAFEELQERGLLATDPSIEPELEANPAVDYADRYVGTLLGGACGDALGRPAETMPPATIRSRYGFLTDFIPWEGWSSGPVGTITDDTQLTMCVAESIVARGEVDPEDMAARFVAWLPVGRGKGQATTEAVLRLQAGVPWHRAGSPSAGNGAAMRAAPVGLLHPVSPSLVVRDAAFTAVITHADAMAAAGAVAIASAVAYCLHQQSESFGVGGLLAHLREVMSGIPDEGLPERRPGAGARPVRLIDQIELALELADRPPEQAFERLHNGALVLESLPAAFYCFAASPDDPERVIVTAANGGFDSDTVASMAGNLVGALNGASALPGRWLDELEFREELERLGRQLLAMSSLGPTASD